MDGTSKAHSGRQVINALSNLQHVAKDDTLELKLFKQILPSASGLSGHGLPAESALTADLSLCYL